MNTFTTIAGVIFVIAIIIALTAYIAGTIIKQVYIIQDLHRTTRKNKERLAQGLPPFELVLSVKREKKSSSKENPKTEE